jgi:transcriptional regulator with XRE-family HTH domain
MVHIPSSMRTRAVGDELIALRRAAGYSGLQMSRKLGWENSRTNRIENGKYNITEVDVTQWVTILGHPRAVLDDLLTMLRQSQNGFVVQPHGARLPDQLNTLIHHETKARTIQNLELMVVPGLLQTRQYAEALIRAFGVEGEDLIEPCVQARVDRQSLFSRVRQPECTFYIHEFALRTTVGDDQVMNAQIMHLAFMANKYGVSIRILPAVLGPNAGFRGAFMMMDYGDEELPVVHVEHEGASLFVDEPAVVEAHAALLNRLDRIALDEGQSRLWLVSLASQYDQPGDDPHALGLP